MFLAQIRHWIHLLHWKPCVAEQWNIFYTKNCCFTSIEDPRLQQRKNYCRPFKLQDGGLLLRCLNFCTKNFLVHAKNFTTKRHFLNCMLHCKMLHFFETTSFYIFCTLTGDNSHGHLHSRKRYKFRRSCFLLCLSVQKTQTSSSQKLLKMPVAFQWSLKRLNTLYLPDQLPKCGVFATNDLNRKHLPQKIWHVPGTDTTLDSITALKTLCCWANEINFLRKTGVSHRLKDPRL